MKMECDKLVDYCLIPCKGDDQRLFTHFDLKYGQMHSLNLIIPEKIKTLKKHAHLMVKRIQKVNNTLAVLTWKRLKSEVTASLEAAFISMISKRRVLYAISSTIHQRNNSVQT
jgi:hypothetical protein